jgi:hypothetical protein
MIFKLTVIFFFCINYSKKFTQRQNFKLNLVNSEHRTSEENKHNFTIPSYTKNLQNSAPITQQYQKMLGFRFLKSGSALLLNQVSKSFSTVTAEAIRLQESALHENCILVDENDKNVGQSSKRDCHKVSETGQLKLHRAFSVFIFNSKGDMLIQRRSTHKVSHKLFGIVAHVKE